MALARLVIAVGLLAAAGCSQAPSAELQLAPAMALARFARTDIEAPEAALDKGAVVSAGDVTAAGSGADAASAAGTSHSGLWWLVRRVPSSWHGDIYLRWMWHARLSENLNSPCACHRAFSPLANLSLALCTIYPSRWNWWHDWWHKQRLKQARENLSWAETEQRNLKKSVETAHNGAGRIAQTLLVRGEGL